MRAIYGNIFDVYSAGTEPTELNSYVVEAMQELNIDISDYKPKSVRAFLKESFDCVVTVCDSARESCPVFPGAKNIIHKSFKDPSEFTGSKDEIISQVREVRDDIKRWIKSNFKNIEGGYDD